MSVLDSAKWHLGWERHVFFSFQIRKFLREAGVAVTNKRGVAFCWPLEGYELEDW